MNRHRARRVLAGAAGCALLLAGWVLLAPSQLGGGTAYVSTFGASMQPRYDDGDLVLVRASTSYEPGDVAAYHSEVLGTTVLHRIVSREADHFVLKGDNNDFVDPDRPRTSELIGKEWVRLPGGGRLLALVAQPAHLAAVAAVALLLAGGTAALRGRRRRRMCAAVPRHASPRGAARYLGLVRVAHAARPVLAVVAVGIVALGTLAFTRPTTTDGTIDYRHTGRFAYDAPAVSGPTYQDRAVRTGDPVFLQLIDALDVTFDYALRTQAPTDLTGTAALHAELRSGSGWRHTIELAPLEPFSGSTVRLRAELDLVRTRALLDQVETTTGVTGGSYTLTLVPTIDVGGTIGGRPTSDRFAPRAEFLFDRLQLRPSVAVEAEGGVGALAPVRARSLDAPGAERTHLEILGNGLAVDVARQLALIAGAVVAVASALVAWITRRAPITPEAGFVARHHDRLVTVRDYRPGADRTTVDVSAVTTIGRIAEQHDRPIVVVSDPAGGRSVYVVEVDRTVYRYRAPALDVTAERLFVVGSSPSPAVAVG